MVKLKSGIKIRSGIKILVSDNDMILVYEIPASDTPIQLAIQANSTWFSDGQAVVINWGDGSAAQTVSDTGGDTYIGHTYTAAGTYKIKISGSMTMYGRDSNVDILGQTLLTRVDSFGKLGLTSLSRAFRRCTGLMSVPKTVPDSVTNMSSMFNGCITANNINLDVSAWDVSNVTNMSYMFYGCRGDEFNPNVTNWDVSNVIDMRDMFENCSGDIFNPDVSNWNVSKVTNMRSMFYNCYGDEFNPNMESWTLKTGVTTTTMFISSRIQPTTWLDELLVAWADNSEQGSNITIDFSPNSFSETTEGEPIPAVADALAILEGKRWTITTANPYPAT